MPLSEGRKRPSISSSPEDDGLMSKRRKDRLTSEDENKENSASTLHTDEEAVDSPELASCKTKETAIDTDDDLVDASGKESSGDGAGEAGLDPEAMDSSEEAGDDDAEEEEDAEDEENEDAEMTTAEARGKASFSTPVPGKVSEAGIIKSIYCENFMCHRKLRVDLNRNVNFIHGQNGSGKSAVLAAIQICLGAGARRTHRARNLKDLIRKDSTTSAMPSCAKIRVTLMNQGSDSYKHDLYGDTITVERTIALNGGYNGYKLLDHKLVEKSRAKKDLDELLDFMNIQVENPVAVLDQEEAKKFLMGKAEDKYNFFMKATELERVDNSYATTLEKVDEMRNANERVKASLQSSIDHVDSLKKQWREHQEISKLEVKHQKACSEYAWACFTEYDRHYQRAATAKAAMDEKVRKKESDLHRAEEAITPGNDASSKRSKIDQLLEEVHKQSELKRELDEELQHAMAPYKETERKISMTKRAKKEVSGQLKAAQRQLKEKRDQIAAIAASAESEEFRRTELLRHSEEQLADARSKVNQLKENQARWLRSYEEVEPHVQDATAKVDDLKHQLSRANNTLQSLQSSSGENSLALLGPRVAALVNLIDKAKRERKFRGEVTGPIGRYIKIVAGKESFAAVAEFAIGSGNLDRFIVNNDHDYAVLKSLRLQAGCKYDCGIFQVAVASRFQIPPKPDVDGIETVASVLSIENDIVFNCLVDTCGIEFTALARDRQYSEDKLLIRNGNGSAIRGNSKKVYLLNGDYWTVKNGAYAMFSNDRKLRQTIGVDATAAISNAQAEIETIRQAIREKERAGAELQHEHTQFQREWNKAKKALRDNDDRINDLTNKIESIKQDMEASTSSTIDTSEFEEAVKEAEEVMANHEVDEQNYVAELKDLLPAVDEAKRKLDLWQVQNHKALKDVEAAESDLTQFLETQTQQMDQIEKKRQKLKSYQDEVARLESDMKDYMKHRDTALKKARIMHFRYEQQAKCSSDGDGVEENGDQQDAVAADPTEEELESIEPQFVDKEQKYYEIRMQKAKERMEKERQRRKVSREDAVVVYERYIHAKEALQVKYDEIDATDGKILDLEKDIDVRKRRWTIFRKHLTKTVGIKFDQMLTMNKYSGSLHFSHETGTLDLAVQKHTANSKAESKDVKALSGGERSYTTMSLLVSLGETLETPFRILDEFDVFMDAETRKLVIQSLIHIAKSLKHRQFIFITPQDLSSIAADDQVKILKLNPPDRHQNAGGPTQQTLNFGTQD